jgi:hypothetical protein
MVRLDMSMMGLWSDTDLISGQRDGEVGAPCVDVVNVPVLSVVYRVERVIQHLSGQHALELQPAMCA